MCQSEDDMGGGWKFCWSVSRGMSPVVLLFETVDSADSGDLSPLVI